MIPLRLLPTAAAIWASLALGHAFAAPAANDQAPPDAGAWRHAAPGHPWSFPADHWSHPGYRTEWWYFTGHLQTRDEPARRFGFQFTIFRVGVLPAPPPLASDWATGGLLMGHASITDVEGGRHVFSEALHRQTPLLADFGVFPDSTIAWSRGPAGTADGWRLTWANGAFAFAAADARQGLAFDLRATPLHPPVLQGPGGLSRKGDEPNSASLYYSQPRMDIAGRLSLGGQVWEVEGTGWMDREFGSDQLDEDQVGWDWFGLQLDDGRSLMIYELRDAAGGLDFGRGTLISAAGEPTYLEPDDWRVEPLANWRSERTGGTYPARWRLSVPSAGLDLLIEPLLMGQENVSERVEGLFYWEGAVEVREAGGREGAAGAPLGRGYVELTGYGPGSRPPI